MRALEDRGCPVCRGGAWTEERTVHALVTEHFTPLGLRQRCLSEHRLPPRAATSYSDVLEPNPRNAPHINVAGGKALADFFVARATQALIGAFGKARFGPSVFIPDGAKADRW